MEFSTLVIIVIGAIAVIAISIVYWYHKDPVAADHAVTDAAGDAVDGAKATGGFIKRLIARLRGKAEN